MPSVSTPLNVAPPPTAARQEPKYLRFGVLVALYLLIVFGLPRPEAVTPARWRLFGLFVSTVAGLMLHPIPGGAIVLIAITLAPLLAGHPLGSAAFRLLRFHGGLVMAHSSHRGRC